MKIRQEEIEKLITDCNLSACFECGKCTAGCPMADFFGGIKYGNTPRGVIEKALLNADLVTGDTIWYCLTCEVCTKGCPSGVCFRDFVEELRKLAVARGFDSYGAKCKCCGNYFLPTITQKTLIKKLDREAESIDYIFLCPVCRRRTFSRARK
ncbi:MAG: 4Fe-4S dicluster domain-containing protein [Candidatus Aminicenantes bacterium]|nr:4Fe-4S dicluster domain-containing protein [Candidatus Aminicenantes bacterium]